MSQKMLDKITTPQGKDYGCKKSEGTPATPLPPRLHRCISVPATDFEVKEKSLNRKNLLLKMFFRSLSVDEYASVKPKTETVKPNSETNKQVSPKKSRPVKPSKVTKWTVEGAWTSRQMPQPSDATKRNPLSSKTLERNGCWNRITQRLAKIYGRKKCFQYTFTESLQLDGPYVNPIVGCTCGECEQEYYSNKYVGYGVDIYGKNNCMVVPANCHDFAVVYYS